MPKNHVCVVLTKQNDHGTWQVPLNRLKLQIYLHYVLTWIIYKGLLLSLKGPYIQEITFELLMELLMGCDPGQKPALSEIIWKCL